MPPSIGMRFGRYVLVARLGSGGMGEVWRARDHDLQRDVAVKFLPERFAADSDRLSRFEQEARAASLNHPNIVTIHEIGQTSGLPYIVMELVEGRTLHHLAREGPLAARALLDIATQIADGLAKAHAAGIVHRDLKPENVMVTADGFVKILDFGLAKLRGWGSSPDEVWFDSQAPTAPEPNAPRTQQGVVLGTVGYMSPEQARGRPIDGRSDQFALGAILYELATGRPAFRRDTPAATLLAIVDEEPEPIARLNPALPEPVRFLIEKRCLAKDPASRHASAAELAHELRAMRDRLASGSELRMPAETEVVGVFSRTPLVGLRRLARDLRTPPWLATAALAALAVAAAVAALALAPSSRERAVVGLGLRALPDEKGVAVLPFATAGAGAGEELVADGVCNVLTERLSQLERFHRALWVVPSREVRESGIRSPSAARRAFGVTLVVTGQVRRLGDRIRLTASLVDAVRQRELRVVGPRDYPLEDSSLALSLTESVARMLDLHLDEEQRGELRRGGTEQGGAHALYLEARGHLQRYEDRGSLEQAASLFQRAIQEDADYALAYAGLAEAQWRLYELSRQSEFADLAVRGCERALQLNDLLAPAYVTCGTIRAGTGKPEPALADFARALALDPADADASRELGTAYQKLGRTVEAEAALRKAVELRPAYWGNHNRLGTFYFSQARYADAERAFRRAVELTPDNARGHTNLGAVLEALGRPEDAIAELRRSLALRATPAGASNLGTLLYRQRRYAEAVSPFEQAASLDHRDHRVWRNLAAALYWTPDGRERARVAWQRAAELAFERLRVDPKDAHALAELAATHAMLGDSARARREIARALAQAPPDVEMLQLAASVLEQAGSRQAALALLERALAGGFPRERLDGDPFLERLRADRRYVTLVAQFPRKEP